MKADAIKQNKESENPFFHKDGRNKPWVEVRNYIARPAPPPPPPQNSQKQVKHVV
jgi:hypothetical protein